MAAVSAFLIGCGSGSQEETRPEKLRPISVTLDGYAGPSNVGVLMAEKLRYFEEAGLEPTVTSPVGPRRPILYVADGSADLGISHLPQVALAQENGVPIVAIASVIPQPTAAMIWLEGSKIQDLTDLKGKAIGIPGIPFQKVFLESLLEGAGVPPDDVRIEPVEYELAPALANGQVDAIFGGSWNLEGADLEERDWEPVITKVQDLGVPDYEELVLIARRDRLKRDPGSIRDFVAAMLRGTEAAIDDPTVALNAIQQSIEANPYLGRKETEAQLEATLPLLSESGEMDADKAAGLIDWMDEEGMIQRRLPVSSLLTDEYLP